jgi:hypothetical protein
VSLRVAGFKGEQLLLVDPFGGALEGGFEAAVGGESGVEYRDGDDNGALFDAEYLLRRESGEAAAAGCHAAFISSQWRRWSARPGGR